MLLEDNPPEGFLRIDFDRGRPDATFNSHIGTLYAKRGEKGTREEFVLGFRVHQHMCNPAGGLRRARTISETRVKLERVPIMDHSLLA